MMHVKLSSNLSDFGVADQLSPRQGETVKCQTLEQSPSAVDVRLTSARGVQTQSFSAHKLIM